jgi:transposase
MDKLKAITAAAHKLARRIYTIVTKREEHTDKEAKYSFRRHHGFVYALTSW